MHRPLFKVKRTNTTLAFGLTQFALTCFIFYFILLKDYDPKLLPLMHKYLYLCSAATLTLLVPAYFLSSCLQPGNLKRRFDLQWLANKLVTNGYHLDNLCVYDEVLKTETSFHC
jgi:ABC-type tungstate transport system substrate-binding protein